MLVSRPARRGERSLQTLAVIATLFCTCSGVKSKREIGCVGSAHTISCECDSSPEYVLWKKNGKILHGDSRIQINNVSLTIKNIDPVDQAMYICRFGHTEHCVQLIVYKDCKNLQPDPTTQLPILSTSPSSSTPIDEEGGRFRLLAPVVFIVFTCVLVIIICVVQCKKRREPKEKTPGLLSENHKEPLTDQV